MSTVSGRTLPDEIEDAISELVDAALLYAHAQVDGVQREITYKRWNELRAAILAALEPERALRERAEHLDRLWRFVCFERECVKHHAFDLWGEALDEIRTELDALGEPPPLPKDIKPGDLADDIPTATSSVQTPS